MPRPFDTDFLRRASLPLLLAAALQSATPLAAQRRPMPIQDQDRKAAVEEIGRLLTENYIFPDVAQKAGAAIAAKETAGAYAKLEDPFAFAEALTRDLQEVTHDKHIRVGPRPPAPPGAAQASPPPPDPAAEEREMKARNFGFREIKLLPGNIGYLQLDGFVPAGVGGRTAVAAMEFLGGADALIFDLRQNGGGDPTMIQLLSSYLFSEPTHLNDLYWRAGERREQFWTLPWTPGQSRPEVPVYVLTSARTFSAAEEFTNNLKVLKRATIVGETTGGGANPGRGFDIGERFQMFVPTGRAINPTTGTNWEGTGVEPDIKTEAKSALLAAQGAALQGLAAKAKEPEAAGRLRFAHLQVEAQLHPFTPAASRLSGYVGQFGPRKIAVEDGKLYYQRENRPRLRMSPVAEDVFSMEGVEDFLARFERDANGRVVKLVGLYDNGESDESPRSGE